MSWSKWVRRLRSSLLAAVAGWLGGVILTLPFEAGIAWRNNDGQLAPAAKTLVLGIIIWGAWTLVFSLLGWLLFAVPLVSLVSPQWLRANRGRVLVACIISAAALPGKFFGLFSRHLTKQFDLHNFLVYSIFGIAYVIGSLLIYLRLEKAEQISANVDEQSLLARFTPRV